MSLHTRTKRLTVPQLVAMKGQQKIVSLTAYTSSIAKLMDPFVLPLPGSLVTLI